MKHMRRVLAMLLALCVALSGGWLSAVPALADEGTEIEYLYGYVNMNYADYYYGELENVEPDGKTTVDSTIKATDKVTKAGYREKGFYDAATFATPGSFIFEAKWSTWAGTYSEPIKNEFGVVEGGKILGVADVPVAISKDLYNAALKDRNATTLKNKIAEIEFAEDQSVVPVSYKVLNSDATYSKWIGTSNTEVNLTGSLISSYMGDDNWWEGKGFNVNNTQTILGGFVEWTDPQGVQHREGLKHDENIYSTTWIGWGVGPNSVGIYGGNEVGWQRFVGMAGGTMTKLSLILMNNDDGSVVYMNGNCGEAGMKSPWLLNGIVEEDGSMPYDVVLKDYAYTKDSVIMDFEYNVPVLEDGTLELDTWVYNYNYPKKNSSYGNITNKNAETGVYEINPDVVTKYEDSGWDENGHRLIHLELDRSKCGTGRYKYWTQNLATNGDRSFGTIARWANLSTGLTMKDMYLEDNKLVINSDIFTVEDYRLNPYQKVVIHNVDDEEAEDVVFSTGDSNTTNSIMTELIKEDGSIDLEGTYKYTKKQNKLDEEGNPVIGSNGRPQTENVPCEDPFFPAGPEATYEITMYCGGFPIIHGVLNQATQEIRTVADEVNLTTSDDTYNLEAEAETAMTFTSDNPAVAGVDAEGIVTVNGPGTATITISAEETLKYYAAEKTVTVTVALPDDDLVYGYVNMNYADYYYGELEGITPDGKTTVTAVDTDPVTEAGYRETGFYDAATFATPGSFIFESKWSTWPGTYSEPIKNEFNVVEGGRILGVADVPVAMSKKLLEAAKADKTAAVLNAKIAEIEWAEDQSAVPVSYKVLNSDATYTKWIGKANTTVNLTGSLISSYMGDDNWWEGKGFNVAKTQTILGGFVEWTDPEGVAHREGLKHDENIYSTTWIGWGVGPNSVGIYGGNEVGWQRFVGMAGGTMTKLSLILMNNDDGSVVYMDGNCGENGMVSPWLLNGIVEEDGSMPYDVVLKSYEYTKDSVILDFDYNVPVLEDGTVELDTIVYNVNYPKKNSSYSNISLPGGDESIVKVYDESEWENGHKTVHIELDRSKAGTGRYKYWTKNLATNGDRSFGTIARWANLSTGLTMKDMYIEDNKLVINSDIFTIEDYRLNPYQKVVVENVSDPSAAVVSKTTGDSNTKNNILTEVLKEDGSFNLESTTYFPAGAEATYDVTMYCGGFPIIHGTINGTAQEITAEDVTKTFGDEAFSLNAEAKTSLMYCSDNEAVASVDAEGTVTINGAGTANITIKAVEEKGFFAAEKTICVTVKPAPQTITVNSAAVTKTFGAKAFSLGAKAKTALTYKSDKPGVATVSKDGKVTIKGAGTATITITAKAGNYEAATKTVKVTVKPAKQTVTVKAANVTKTFGAKAFSLGAKAKTAMTYVSGNKKVVTVSAKGMVTIKGAGKAVITITAKAGNYVKATKKVNVTVKPGKVTLKSLKSSAKKTAVVQWKKRAEATGYEVKYANNKNFKKVKTVTIKKAGTLKTTLKKLTSKKKVFVKVRAYKTVSGKKLYGAFSAVKSVKVK